jgi:hypothetical protein
MIRFKTLSGTELVVLWPTDVVAVETYASWGYVRLRFRDGDPVGVEGTLEEVLTALGAVQPQAPEDEPVPAGELPPALVRTGFSRTFAVAQAHQDKAVATPTYGGAREREQQAELQRQVAAMRVRKDGTP